MSVAGALVDQLQQIAARHDARRVSIVILRAGPLSGVEPGLLRRAFPVAAAGTVAAGAELVIDAADIRVQCRTCGAESAAAPNRLLCGECGDFRTRVVSGDELILDCVELDCQPDRSLAS